MPLLASSHSFHSKPLTLLSALVLLSMLAGCASVSTPSSRRQERADAYLQLPPQHQLAVDGGQLRAGMNFDAAYIAWGPPQQIHRTNQLTIWSYLVEGYREQRTVIFQDIHTGASDARVLFPERALVAQIHFENGQVATWKRWRHGNPAPLTL